MKFVLLRRALRRYFMAGLLVWLPILATVLVVRFILEVMDRTLVLLPPAVQPQALFGFRLPGFGAALGLIVLLLTGLLVSNMLGRSLMRLWDDFLNRIPFVRGIYGGVKNFSTSILSSSGHSFKKVLLVEYPRAGIWSIGLQTAADVPVASAPLASRVSEPLVCVFVPTTPNPTSGFIFLVPRSQVIELPISVEEAMKMIVTLGVVAPGGGATGPAPTLPPGVVAVSNSGSSATVVPATPAP